MRIAVIVALCCTLAEPAESCPLDALTMRQIGASIRAARANTEAAVAELERSRGIEFDDDKRRAIAARLRRNITFVDQLLSCQQFK